MAGTVNKHIRIDGEIWERLEAAAKDRETKAEPLPTEPLEKQVQGTEDNDSQA